MSPVAEPRRHLGVGAAFSVLVQGGPLIAGATLSIVLARTIGPSANGRFALLGTLVGLVELVFSLGLVGRNRVRGQPAPLVGPAGVPHAATPRRSRSAWRASASASASSRSCTTRSSAAFSTSLAIVALTSLPLVLAYVYADSILLARERYEGYAGLELSHSATFFVVGAGLAIPVRGHRRRRRAPCSGGRRRASSARFCSHAKPLATPCVDRGWFAWAGDPLRPAELGCEPPAADQLPLRRPDPRRLRSRARRRRLFRRADADEHGVGVAAGTADGAVPARGKPRRSDARGRDERARNRTRGSRRRFATASC